MGFPCWGDEILPLACSEQISRRRGAIEDHPIDSRNLQVCNEYPWVLVFERALQASHVVETAVREWRCDA